MLLRAWVAGVARERGAQQRLPVRRVAVAQAGEERVEVVGVSS